MGLARSPRKANNPLMRARTQVTLFPFLSVLISTMGVLSFLAVTFLLFAQQSQQEEPKKREVEVSWVGAPPHVRPILVEIHGHVVRVHGPTWKEPQVFSVQQLKEEVKIVKELRNRGLSQMGILFDRYRLWLFMKSAIPKDDRLRGSFTLAMHALELYNLSGAGRKNIEQRYPILLVYAGGVSIYELASFLLDTTTQMNVGLEPMLENWALPYTKSS